MKRAMVILLCTLLLALAGCAAPCEPAIDEKLLEVFGKPGEEAVKVLGLTNEMAFGDGLYVKEYNWCGLPMQMELCVEYGGDGIFGSAVAYTTLADDAASVQTLRACAEQLVEQYGAPFAVRLCREVSDTAQDVTEEVFDAARMDVYFAYLADAETGGGVQFGFDLNDRCRLICSFMKCTVDNECCISAGFSISTIL